MSAHLLRRLSAMEAELRHLRAAAIALRDDLLMRAEIDRDGTKVVNASHGRWMRFCAAINPRDRDGAEGIAQTPDNPKDSA